MVYVVLSNGLVYGVFSTSGLAARFIASTWPIAEQVDNVTWTYCSVPIPSGQTCPSPVYITIQAWQVI